jgi:tol-pal system protein YbgF
VTVPAGAPGRRRLALIAVVAPLGALLAACATPGGSRVQSDLDSIQQQLWKVQKDGAALGEQIAAIRDATARAGAAAGGPGAAGPPAAAAPETGPRLEAIERDLQALRARADESDRRLVTVAEDLRAAREALQALAQALGTATPPAAPGGIVPALPGAGGGTAAGAPAVEDLYRQGIADFAKGNHALALQELNEFVSRSPSSPLADDALFTIGEVQCDQQHYPEAIAAYDRLLQAYPGGDRVAAAYLKKGLALLEMNRTADAVIQLQHVVSAYPRSEEARVARERLRGLGLKER